MSKNVTLNPRLRPKSQRKRVSADVHSVQVRDREPVTRLSGGQEEQLLRDVRYPSTFHRKMAAHGVLYSLHYFLVDARRVIVNKRPRPRVVTAVAWM